MRALLAALCVLTGATGTTVWVGGGPRWALAVALYAFLLWMALRCDEIEGRQ